MKTNFAKNKNNSIVFHSLEDELTFEEKINPDFYQVSEIRSMFSGSKPMFTKIESKDKLISFKSGKVKEIIDSTQLFFNDKTISLYKEMDIVHKMGIILYGPPGTGKTSTANIVMNQLCVNFNTICLDCTGLTVGFIKFVINELRKIQDNPIVIFIDEIDSSINRQEESFLSFLDGNDSISNSIIIGCTNNLGSIPNRIKNRKSRIKHLIEIKSFPIEVYETYIKEKSVGKLKNEDVSKIAYLSEEKGLTLDQVKHIVIDYVIEGIPIEDNINLCEKLE